MSGKYFCVKIILCLFHESASVGVNIVWDRRDQFRYYMKSKNESTSMQKTILMFLSTSISGYARWMCSISNFRERDCWAPLPHHCSCSGPNSFYGDTSHRPVSIEAVVRYRGGRLQLEGYKCSLYRSHSTAPTTASTKMRLTLISTLLLVQAFSVYSHYAPSPNHAPLSCEARARQEGRCYITVG